MNPLTKKVGPLPVGVWALVVGGGYLAYRHFSGGSSAPATGSGTYTDAAGNVYDANGNLISPAVSDGSGGLGMSGSNGGTTVVGIDGGSLNKLVIPLHSIEKQIAKEEKTLASLAAKIKRNRKPKHHRSTGGPKGPNGPTGTAARRPKAPRVHHPKRHAPVVAQHGR